MEPDDPRHGTDAGYQQRCPCDACREAHRLAHERWRRRKGMKKIAHPAPHGSRSKYSGGCRCDECRAANRAYMREWQRKDRQEQRELRDQERKAQ